MTLDVNVFVPKPNERQHRAVTAVQHVCGLESRTPTFVSTGLDSVQILDFISLFIKLFIYLF